MNPTLVGLATIAEVVDPIVRAVLLAIGLAAILIGCAMIVFGILSALGAVPVATIAPAGLDHTICLGDPPLPIRGGVR